MTRTVAVSCYPLCSTSSIVGMKVSVSLPGEDVRFLDEYAKEQGLESRSAALLRAVRLLRTAELGAAYESAWEQWTTDSDSRMWDSTVGDGLPDRAPS
jgi:Arc/MetJ-type ribon-helix-helix transcriptional regulator